MRIGAQSEQEYKQLTLLQNLMTQRFKEERENDPDGPLTLALKAFINTPLDKTWIMPDEQIQAANSATMDTEDHAMFIPYIIHAAVNRKKVAIEYVSNNKPMSKRIIEPMNYSRAKSGGVNIVAWCHSAGAWRHFNPANIQRVAVLDEDFDRPEDVELKPEHARELSEMIAGMS
ncbi:hypothetical protein D3C76_622200 [compost metagenome]